MVNAHRTGIRAFALGLALAFGLVSWTGGLQAQTEQPKSEAPAAAGAEPLTIQWLKFCEFSLVRKADKKKAKVCLVHYEQRAADNGSVLVSAAIRQIEGEETEKFIVMVPLGVAIPPGLKVRVDKQDPIPMRYTLCHPQGCTAEGEATKEFVAALKKGGTLYVAAINAFGRGFALPVTLTGFTKTYEGPATEAATVEEIRKKEWDTIQALYAEQKAKLEASKKSAN